MERKEAQSIGDVLRLAFQENCMQDRLDERRAVAAWSDVIGVELAAQCMRPDMRDGVMTVGIRNASLRHELSMSRSSLARAINARLGRTVVEDIRFTAPKGASR